MLYFLNRNRLILFILTSNTSHLRIDSTIILNYYIFAYNNITFEF